MDTPRESNWESYRALREQWVHEDDLVHYRMVWLILSQGLLLNAYGMLSSAATPWIAIGLPLFGMALTALIASSIFASLASAAEIGRRYEEAGPGLPALAPQRRFRSRGDRATRALPFVFAALWLPLAGALAR
jgi:hypothetical protein